MKVFITGIGSDLGTTIAQILERRHDVTAIAGVDMFPPRRYLARTQFSMTRYDDSEKISDVIVKFSPDVIINFGVYEPGARLSFSKARAATHASTSGIVHAVERISHDVRVVTRSSLVVYGFENAERTRDETSPIAPDTPYGELCRDVEEQLLVLGNIDIIRTAPEIGAHVPHPLARALLLPALPIQLRLPFSREIGFPVISPRDITHMFVSVLGTEQQQQRIFHGACSSNATISMAVRIGRRLPLISTGIDFAILKQLFYFAGAPIDPHVEMWMRRGMAVDSTATRMNLSISSQDSSTEILHDLYVDRETAFDATTFAEVPK